MIYLGDKEIGVVIEQGEKPNLLPYLVTYIEQEDGTYEMQIRDYVEGGVGEKVFIGTTNNSDGTMNIYIYYE